MIDARLLRTVGNRVSASDHLVKAAFEELQAALMIGKPKEVEEARTKCLSAYEAYLDRFVEAIQTVQRMQL
jgi:hypothetical protein